MKSMQSSDSRADSLYTIVSCTTQSQCVHVKSTCATGIMPLLELNGVGAHCKTVLQKFQS